MKFKEAFSKMVSGLSIAKEKQENSISKVKQEVTAIENKIKELKNTYSTSLDFTLLDEITTNEIKKRDLESKIKIMSEALKTFSQDVKLSADFEGEINSIFAPVLKCESEYINTLKKAKDLEKKLIGLIEQSKPEVGQFVRNYKSIRKEDRDVIRETIGINRKKMLFGKSQDEIDSIKPLIHHVVSVQCYYPSLPHEYEISRLEKAHEEKQSMPAHDWIAG